MYDRILDLMWDELIKGENDLGSVNNALVLMVFSLFSIVLYYLRDYDDLILFIVALIWLLDAALARYTYRYGAKYERIALKSNGNRHFTWERTNPQGETDFDVDFSASEVKRVMVSRFNRTGGVFQRVMGASWRTQLVLNDDFELLISEENEAGNALRKGEKIAAFYRVPFEISGSEDPDSIVVRRQSDLDNCLNIDQYADRIKISSRRDLIKVWHHLLKILKESGFLLFVIAMEGVMIRWGMLINHYIGPYLGKGPSTKIQPSLSALVAVFKPKLDWPDIMEYSVALGVVLYTGIKMFKQTSLVIDRERMSYSSHDRELSTLNTQKLRKPVYLKHPDPMILLTDMHRSIEIVDFGSEKEYKALWIKIREAINKFVPSSTSV